MTQPECIDTIIARVMAENKARTQSLTSRQSGYVPPMTDPTKIDGLMKMYEGALKAQAVTKLAEAVFLATDPEQFSARGRAKYAFNCAEAFFAERDARFPAPTLDDVRREVK